jgi:cell division protein FtsI (penicillin-binding protein 3)
MSALQILALYNAVANDGKLVKPRLVDRVQRGEKLLEAKEVDVLKPSICSAETIAILQDLMIEVVKNGTATNIYSEKYSCAGKTGTAKIASEGSYGSEYRSSFAGYFPTENPKYSCIVVVTKPKKEIGFYGNVVAAPVFEEVRDLLYAEEAIETPRIAKNTDIDYVGKAQEINDIHKTLNYSKYEGLQKNIWLKSDKENFEVLDFEEGEMPNLKGMSAMDALYLLENLGIEVELQGRGKVTRQSLKAGNKINKKQKVALRLS